MPNRQHYLFIGSICLMVLLLTSCAPKMVTKADKFPLMYEEMPVSILLLPPINETTAADAKEYYSTTLQEPISFSGYYVFPYEVTSEVLKMEGIYDAELLKDLSVTKFREYFGADAVLFTTIKKWDISYIVIASNLTVSIDCELKSTKSEQVLWSYNGTVVIDLSGGGSGGSIAGLIVKSIVTAINTATADYVPYARVANYRAISSVPYGKYHKGYLQDKEQKIVEQRQ
ncbi:MAG: DUF799 family lipoprotein [Bacteroidales bacterium]|nr:DUF799 family lipoprotein [Bacteroidales bacterium]